MSGAQPPPAGASNDPSMEDILASIRRILSEDEPVATPVAEEPPNPVAETPAAPAAAEPEPDDVLVLDDSMLVPEPAPVADAESDPEPEPVMLAPSPLVPEPVAIPEPPPYASFTSDLLGPEAAAAATTSVSNLVRTLATDRSTQVYHGGPTIEDIVREEVRPLLKLWLDENLPPMVERLVRIEIERVVGRAMP